MKTRAPRSRPAVAVVTAMATGLLLLGGCGGGDDEEEATEGLDPRSESARNFLGRFANVPNPPAGSAEITGIAEMTIDQGKTQVTALVAGLTDKAVYIAHVHNDVCSADDPGGAHFKFDPDGGDSPPNEIHLPFVDEPAIGSGLSIEAATGATPPSAIDGKGGSADVVVDEEAGPDAKSVVVHLQRKADATSDEQTPPKVACADLKPDTGTGLGPDPTAAPTP